MTAEFLGVFKRTREILSDPSAWTKHHNFADKDGNLVAEGSPLACKFCMVGALMRAEVQLEDPNFAPSLESIAVFRELMNQVLGQHILISEWNDAPERQHGEVLKMIDAVIDLSAAE